MNQRDADGRQLSVAPRSLARRQTTAATTTNRVCRFDASARRIRLGSLAATLFFIAASLTTSAQADNAPATDEVLIKNAGFSEGDVGYLVVDLDGKREVAEHNPDQPFVPASVAKIATFVPALEVLGGDHQFTTTISVDGSIADEVLTGSVILRGGGDPFLTGDDLSDMAKQLAASGIKQVNGEFLYDATSLIQVPEIDATQPKAADYNCGVSSLSVDFNRVRLDWKSDGADRSATAAAVSDNLTSPLGSIDAEFADHALPGPFVRGGSPSDDRWLLSSDLSATGTAWLPVADPSRIAAELFRAVAANEGIVLPEPTPGATSDGARELVRHDSDPLSDIARQALRSSNNLAAELIGLATSRALTGRELNLEGSASTLEAWWRSHLPNANWTDFFLSNHSGLSSKSRATPRQVVTMLEEAVGLPSSVDFPDMLRPLGWKGIAGSGHVKTGTMSYVNGLAGYIDTVAGHRLVFAIFFNDTGKRAALDATFDPRVLAIDSQSRSWRDRALKLEDDLTKSWAGRF